MNSKPLLILSTVALVLLSSCKNSVTEIEQELLRGQIVGWRSDTYQNILQVSISIAPNGFTLDSTVISDEGTFAIRLPFASPPDTLLRQFVLLQLDSNQYMSKRDLRVYSNPNAKYAELALVLRDTREGFRWPLYCGNTFINDDSLSKVGDYEIAYYYFSQPTTISGSYRIIFYDTIGINEFRHSSFITNYNLDVTAGWNVVQTRIISDDHNTRIYAVSSTDASDKKWFAVFFISRGFELASSL